MIAVFLPFVKGMVNSNILQTRMYRAGIYARKQVNVPPSIIYLRYPPGCVYTIGHGDEQDAQDDPPLSAQAAL